MRAQIAFWYERDTVSQGELRYQRENHQYLAGSIERLEARLASLSPVERQTEELQTERARLLAENELVHDRLAEVFAKNEEYDRQLTDTYAEIDRLNAILGQIYESRSWKLHLLLDRIRGRS
jgi:regulator of replication initiation timing